MTAERHAGSRGKEPARGPTRIFGIEFTQMLHRGQSSLMSYIRYKFSMDSSPRGRNNRRMSHAAGPSFQPLYLQIRALLTRSLDAGEWKPGEAIPSELELAGRHKVSH